MCLACITVGGERCIDLIVPEIGNKRASRWVSSKFKQWCMDIHSTSSFDYTGTGTWAKSIGIIGPQMYDSCTMNGDPDTFTAPPPASDAGVRTKDLHQAEHDGLCQMLYR